MCQAAVRLLTYEQCFFYDSGRLIWMRQVFSYEAICAALSFVSRGFAWPTGEWRWAVLLVGIGAYKQTMSTKVDIPEPEVKVEYAGLR